MHHLAEVAAVPETGRALDLQPVVDPLPHEAALAAFVPLEQLVVAGQAAGAVAHGVGVLAQDERHRAAARVLLRVGQRRLATLPDQLDLRRRGVHPRVDVRAPAALVALVVDRPVVATVQPPRHRLQVRADAGLVPERPHHHTGMVLVPLDHAGHSLPQRLEPAGIGAGIALPADQFEPVGLQVALVHDQQAVLVAQVEEVRMRRVVAGAHRVQVVALHGEHVGTHHVAAHSAATAGVELVAVDAAELHPGTVEQQQPVADLDPPEPDPHLDGLARADHPRPVQPGRLRRPRLDPACGDRERVRADVCEYAEFGDLEPGGPVVAARAAPHPGPQAAGTGARVVVADQLDVLDPAGGAVPEADLPEQSGQPPLVLILDVASGRPLRDADRDQVLPGPELVGDVELDRQPGAGVLADRGAVHRHHSSRVGALQPEVPAPGGRRRQVEGPPVVAGRVVRRGTGHVDRERVADVGVGGCAPALQLPVARHGDPVPPGSGVGPVGGGVGPPGQPERPLPAQVDLGSVAAEGRPRWHGAARDRHERTFGGGVRAAHFPGTSSTSRSQDVAPEVRRRVIPSAPSAVPVPVGVARSCESAPGPSRLTR